MQYYDFDALKDHSDYRLLRDLKVDMPNGSVMSATIYRYRKSPSYHVMVIGQSVPDAPSFLTFTTSRFYPIIIKVEQIFDAQWNMFFNFLRAMASQKEEQKKKHQNLVSKIINNEITFPDISHFIKMLNQSLS